MNFAFKKVQAVGDIVDRVLLRSQYRILLNKLLAPPPTPLLIAWIHSSIIISKFVFHYYQGCCSGDAQSLDRDDETTGIELNHKNTA